MNKQKNNKMNNDNKPNKSTMYYYLGLLLVVLCFNLFFMPFIKTSNTKQINYNEFNTMIENKKVESVLIDKDKLIIKLKGEDKKTYLTGYIEDPEMLSKLDANDVEYSKAIQKENSPLQNFIISWILPIFIFAIIWKILFKNVFSKMNSMGSGMMSMGKSKAKEYTVTESSKTFKDVAGQDEAKEALSELVTFLNDPVKFKEIGAKMPKGALLVGPPGTGKTLLAQAIAGEAKVSFLSISGSEFVEMFVGMGASRVRDLFKQAKEKAPCIIFIDEIDAIGKKRDGRFGGNDEREQTLNQLLSEMDGFENELGIVILAATNRPESLDKALLRPGRFDRRIPVELPDLLGREAILKVHSKNVKISKNIDFNAIARATSGASGAELANIINEAALRAVKMNRTEVEQSDIEESVEVIIAGYQRKGAVISEKEKQIIAYHEVGHALVAAMGKHSAPVHKITIIPRTSGALGYTMQVDEAEKVLMSKNEALDKIKTFTGGRAAEEIVFGIKTSGASNDIEQATKIARAMITRFGMSDEIGMVALETVNNQYLGGDASLMCSSETSTKIDIEVINTVKICHNEAIDILNNNRNKLNEISEYLLKNETISGNEFMDILNDKYELVKKEI